MKEGNPFTPDYPVPPDLFVGRIKHLKSLKTALEETSHGAQRYIFVTGERGIGKTSFAGYSCEIAQKKYNFLSVHLTASSAHTNEELTRLIFEEILKETSKNTWFDRIKGLFGDYIQQVDLFGVNLAFRPPKEKLEDITRNFPSALKSIFDKIKSEKKGIFLILDDINGICKSPSFALWLKGIVDYIATHYRDLPLSLMVIGVPEVRKELSDRQPSILRIFQVVEIERLSDKEVEEFFTKTFQTRDITIEEDALSRLVSFSSGLPTIMQEIGSGTYRILDGNVVNKTHALMGTMRAADIIGKKYLHPKVYDTISSPRYISILRKMGGPDFTKPFKKSDIEKSLTDSEKQVFHNFLSKMKELGVIIPVQEMGRGYYQYVNQLYPVYIWMESYRKEHKSKTNSTL